MTDEPSKSIPIEQVSDSFLRAWRENGDLTHAEYEAEMKRRYPPDGDTTAFNDGWQPIETAPKEIWFLGCSEYENGWMQTLMFENWGKRKEKWVLINLTGDQDTTRWSHWMPLPMRPSAK